MITKPTSQKFSIKVESRNLNSRAESIPVNQIISVQSDWIATPETADAEVGFLATCFSSKEILELFENGATFFLAQADDEELLGFAITTDIDQFAKQFSNPTLGFYESLTEFKTDSVVYLYQLVVKIGNERLGVGSKMMKSIFSTHKTPILCDVLNEPISNKPSILFFKKNGFKEIGTLRLKNYRNFGPLASKVYLFNPNA